MKIKIPAIPDPRTRDGVKTIVNFVVSKATTFTIMAIIRQNVETDNALSTGSVFIGAYVIGDMVGDATEPYVNRQIDEIADSIAEAKEEAKKKIEEARTA